jgi:hypothetical protein
MCEQSRTFLARFHRSTKKSFDKNAESPMTPVGPHVFGESSGFPFNRTGVRPPQDDRLRDECNPPC